MGEQRTDESTFSDKQQIRLFMFNSEKELKEGLDWITGDHDFEDAKEDSLEALLKGVNTLYSRTGAHSIFALCKKWEKDEKTGAKKLRLMKSLEASSIIKFNALVCALALFTWLSSKEKVIEDTMAEEEWVQNPEPYILAIRKCQREEYFQTWMRFMTPHITERPSGPTKVLTHECFIPIIYMMIEDRYSEKEYKGLKVPPKRINKLLNSLRTMLSSYRKNENIRQLYRLNNVYIQLVSRIVDAVRVGSKLQDQNDPIDRIVTAFFAEMVFHVRALTSCEKDLDRQGITPSSQYDTYCLDATWPFVKLKVRAMTPMVFGVDDIDFTNFCGIRDFMEFVQQTSLLTYWYVSADTEIEHGFLQTCETACELLRECLSDTEFIELIDQSQRNPSYGATGGKLPNDRLVLVDECFKRYGFTCNYESMLCCNRDVPAENHPKSVHVNLHEDTEPPYQITLVDDDEKRKCCRNSEEQRLALEEQLTRYATIWYQESADGKAWSALDPNCRYERNIKLVFKNKRTYQYYKQKPERLKNRDILVIALEPVIALSETKACYELDYENLHILFWDEEETDNQTRMR